MSKRILTLVMALLVVLTAMVLPAMAEETTDEEVIAKLPAPGWVLDGVNGAVWQDDRASMQIYLEDEDNYKVQITWANSATEVTEWVFACDYDAETQTLKARYAICDNVVYDADGNETDRTNVYEKEESNAVFAQTEEGKVTLTDADDESLEGKTFEIIIYPTEETTK